MSHPAPIDVLPSGRFLTSQERQFVGLYAQGMTAKAAARAAGMTISGALELVERQDVIETLAVLRQRMTEELGGVITRDFVGGMILEAHKKAATATEEIAAARELAKLYGLNAPEKQVHVQYNITRVEQLEALPDAELARLAGLDAAALGAPEPLTIDQSPEVTYAHNDAPADD